MPTESTTIIIVVRRNVPPAWPWEVGDKIHDEAMAKLNTRADGGGACITGNATGDSEVIPIQLLTKTANQSTARQAGDRVRGASAGRLAVQLHPRWPEQLHEHRPTAVVVPDTIPDGIEYLGGM